jgi:hypothetical protein
VSASLLRHALPLASLIEEADVDQKRPGDLDAVPIWRRHAIERRLCDRQFVLIGLDKLSMTQQIRILGC